MLSWAQKWRWQWFRTEMLRILVERSDWQTAWQHHVFPCLFFDFLKLQPLTIYIHEYLFCKIQQECKYTFNIIFLGVNFKIRVGEDGDNIENNPTCFEGTLDTSYPINVTCSPSLYGDWISLSKSPPSGIDERLMLYEVRVFSEYIKMHKTKRHNSYHNPRQPSCHLRILVIHRSKF